MTNKQVKIIENQIEMLKKEHQEILDKCTDRLTHLANTDGTYQNYQGQLTEKNKRLKDFHVFLDMIKGEKTDGIPRNESTKEKASGPSEIKRRKRKLEAGTSKSINDNKKS